MRIAVNGFGRIGRIFLRTILTKQVLMVVAINDLADTQTLAHLFKYDSVHRGFKGTVIADGDNLIINGQRIKILAEKDPSQLPWTALNIDVVIEATGKFTTRAGAYPTFNCRGQKSNYLGTIG
jgi:glyceraldehyde 3-phosphate dehydrogenase